VIAGQMMITYTCLYCGNVLRPRNKEMNLKNRMCGICKTRVLIPTEEYDRILKEIAEELVNCPDAEWISLSDVLKDVDEVEEGRFWIARIDRLLAEARKRYF